MQKTNPMPEASTAFLGWSAFVFAILASNMPTLAKAILCLMFTAIFAAFVVLQDAPRRDRIAVYLEQPGYDGLYLRLARPVAKWPRDWRCYDWALRLAVLYPILSMVLLWACTGKAGTVGTVEFLPAHDSWVVTVATICARALAFSAPLLGNWATASKVKGLSFPQPTSTTRATDNSTASVPTRKASPQVSVACPHCKYSLAVDAVAAGQTVQCPQCNRPLVIPPSTHS